MDINDYFTTSEASYRWEVSAHTLRGVLKETTRVAPYLEKGWVKHFIQPNKQRGEWILSRQFMEDLFGEQKY